VTFTVTFRLEQVSRSGSELVAAVGSDYGGVHKERRVDQVVINHGTVPNDELYFSLKPLSSNLGEVDHARLLDGLPQTARANPRGSFQLFRIGDAVSARNTHAAIYDALRLAKEL
jgi:NADPH-dependent 2,4-dienoyl-CoA reductase/sulfur reductase-like enzyme